MAGNNATEAGAGYFQHGSNYVFPTEDNPYPAVNPYTGEVGLYETAGSPAGKAVFTQGDPPAGEVPLGVVVTP